MVLFTFICTAWVAIEITNIQVQCQVTFVSSGKAGHVLNSGQSPKGPGRLHTISYRTPEMLLQMYTSYKRTQCGGYASEG